MFELETHNADLYQHELIRLGLADWITPITKWMHRRDALAWMLVCDGCDPRVQLSNALEQHTNLTGERLLDAVAGLKINRYRLNFSGSPMFDPIRTDFEAWVFQHCVVAEDSELTLQRQDELKQELLSLYLERERV